MIKIQWVSIGLRKSLCSDTGEMEEAYVWVEEGSPQFDPSKPYELVPEDDEENDPLHFDEARAIECMYERSYHWSNQTE